MTPHDFTTILEECRGIREAVHAAWQRMRDKRVEAIAVTHPDLVGAYGIEHVRAAVGVAVAGVMLRADADLCRELGRERGLGEREAHRAAMRLAEGEI